MGVFDGVIERRGNVFKIRESFCDPWIDVWLDDRDVDKLKWAIVCDSLVNYTARTDEWDIFMGPYIDGAVTGYIVQLINLHSRKVTAVSVPFTDKVDVHTVKESLRILLD